MENDFAQQRAGDLVEALDRGAIAPPASRRFSELTLTIVRPLTPDDLIEAHESGVDVAAPTSLGAVRHAHHKLAMLICQGQSPTQISFITGYSPGYISALQHDPLFKELLAYYGAQAEQHHVDVMDRLKTLSLTSIEELQSRLEIEPEKWTKNELMAVAKLGAVEAPAAAAKAAMGTPAGLPGGVNIAVNFVQHAPLELAETGPQIDVSARVIPPEQEI